MQHFHTLSRRRFGAESLELGHVCHCFCSELLSTKDVVWFAGVRISSLLLHMMLAQQSLRSRSSARNRWSAHSGSARAECESKAVGEPLDTRS